MMELMRYPPTPGSKYAHAISGEEKKKKKKKVNNISFFKK